MKKAAIGFFSSMLVAPEMICATEIRNIVELKKETLSPNEEITITLSGNEHVLRYSDVIDSIKENENIEEGVILEIIIHEESATISVNVDNYLRNLPILEGSHNPPNFITSR